MSFKRMSFKRVNFKRRSFSKPGFNSIKLSQKGEQIDEKRRQVH